MDKAYYGRLLRQYFSDKASHAEREALFEGLQQYSNENEWEELVMDLITDVKAERDYDPKQMQTMIQGILNRPAKVVRIYSSRNRWTRRLAAAAVIVGILIGGYWLFNVNGEGDRLRQAQTDVSINSGQDIKAPEVNRAMITLSDGRQVYLDQVGSGSLANVNGVEVIKEADGKIVYRESSSVNRENVNRDASTVLSMTYNTLTNPRGSKVIDITLSDGSRVWLNAGSSLKYPVVFSGDKREVELEGEGYFEVRSVNRESSIVKGNSAKADRIKGGKIPFFVRSGEVVTEVVGTQFNVNAYEDEVEIRVTLLEGRVNVKRESSSVNRESVKRESVKLVPGQSAVATNFAKATSVKKTTADEAIQVKRNVDREEVMAWKEGRFYFMSTDIRQITRELERWYNVDIEIRGDVRDKFTGIISRDVNASVVFDMLQKTGTLHIKIDGKKIIISP